MNLTKQGDVRIEFKFSDDTAVALTCIVHAEFDNLMEIDYERNISINWSGS